MSDVQTEGTNLAVVEETTFNAFTPPAVGWRNLQPNSYGNFGSQYKKTPRDPISKNLQLRKGMLTDQDSMIPFETDITKDAIDRFAPGIFRCAPKHSGGTGASGWSITSVDTDGINVSGGDADLLQRSLVIVRGLAVESNNGLKLVGAGSTTSKIAIAGLTAEAAPPANAEVEFAGFRFATGDAVMTDDGNVTVTTADFEDLGLNVEQWVVIGGRQDSALYSFDNLTYQGAAKVAAIAAGQLTLERHTWLVVEDFVFTTTHASETINKVAHGLPTGFGPVTLTTTTTLPSGYAAATPYWVIATGDDTLQLASSYSNALAGTPVAITDDGTGTHTLHTGDPGTGQEVEIYFTRWYRNVPIDHEDYRTPSWAFEVTFPELDDGNDEYLYLLGNMIDECVWNFPLTGKATMNLSFVGCRTRNPTPNRVTGPSSALDPTTEAGVSTSTDLQRLRIAGTDEVGIATDFTSLKVTDKNNVTAQKQLGRLGARRLNQGKHTSMIEAEVIFTDSDVILAVRDNRDAALDILMRNEDFGALLDVQRLTLDSSDPKMERDKIVGITSKATGFQHRLSTDSLSVFAYLPELPEEDQ